MFYARFRSRTITMANRIFNCPATIFALEINEHNGEWGKHTRKECIWKIRRDDTLMSISFNIRQGMTARNYTAVRTLHFMAYVTSADKITAQR